eukprot:12579041-Alexandrium_andersonii.AAC.1
MTLGLRTRAPPRREGHRTPASRETATTGPCVIPGGAGEVPAGTRPARTVGPSLLMRARTLG